MSRLTFTMKSLLAIGAATALTVTASADVTKPTPPTTEEAKAPVAGNGAGKQAFRDLNGTQKVRDIEAEGNIALNGIAAPSDKLGPIKGESQRALKFDGIDGEAKDREPSAINAGCEPYPACARNKEAMEEEIAAPVKAEGFKPVAGAAMAKGSDGEDRLVENVTLNFGVAGEDMPDEEATEEPAASRPPPPERPSPRIQRR